MRTSDMSFLFPRSLRASVQLISLSWVAIGWIAAVFGLLGHISPLLTSLLIVPLWYGAQVVVFVIRDIRDSKMHPVFTPCIVCIFHLMIGSHFIGVLLPETGFDALWYHLPVIQSFIDDSTIVYDPRWYQSLYPLLGDMLHLLGFVSFGVVGAKIVSYGIMITLLVVVYEWLRSSDVDVWWAVFGMTVVGLFQVVSWQASSAYVDVMMAVWFVAGVRQLLSARDNTVIWSGLLLLSAVPATKFIGLAYVPLIAVIIGLILVGSSQFRLIVRTQRRLISASLFTALIFASFWYIRAGLYTGNPLYPMGTIYAEPVIAQMERGGWGEWLVYRLSTIHLLLPQFFVANDGYTTQLLWMIPAIIIIQKLRRVGAGGVAEFAESIRSWLLTGGTPLLHSISQYYQPLIYSCSGLFGLVFWWFFPPPSTRYVLGPMIVLWIGVVSWAFGTTGQLHWLRVSYRRPFRVAYVAVVCILLANLLIPLSIRLGVNTRGLPYLLGRETQQQYLDRFRNGFTDVNIDAFYGR